MKTKTKQITCWHLTAPHSDNGKPHPGVWKTCLSIAAKLQMLGAESRVLRTDDSYIIEIATGDRPRFTKIIEFFVAFMASMVKTQKLIVKERDSRTIAFDYEEVKPDDYSRGNLKKDMLMALPQGAVITSQVYMIDGPIKLVVGPPQEREQLWNKVVRMGISQRLCSVVINGDPDAREAPPLPPAERKTYRRITVSLKQNGKFRPGMMKSVSKRAHQFKKYGCRVRCRIDSDNLIIEMAEANRVVDKFVALFVDWHGTVPDTIQEFDLTEEFESETLLPGEFYCIKMIQSALGTLPKGCYLISDDLEPSGEPTIYSGLHDRKNRSEAWKIIKPQYIFRSSWHVVQTLKAMKMWCAHESKWKNPRFSYFE